MATCDSHFSSHCSSLWRVSSSLEREGGGVGGASGIRFVVPEPLGAAETTATTAISSSMIRVAIRV